MAWIVEKKRKPLRAGTVGAEEGFGPVQFQVRWRNEEGRTHSRSFPTREQAEAYAIEKTQGERRSLHALDRISPQLERDGYQPIFAPGWDQPEDVFENYLRRIIDQDSGLRQASRENYLAGLKKHIEGTSLGRSGLRSLAESPRVIDDFWVNLCRSAGVGAQRNVHVLLSKAFERAVWDGIIDTSPLKRLRLKVPSKERREEIIPLTVAELEALADAARWPRDRLAILLMGYAGLRAGEVGGLRVQDVDFEKCKLSIRQQVVQTHREKKVAPLKTRSARRTIEVACSVTEELKAFVADNPATLDGRIFHGSNGDLWAHSKINRQVQSAAQAAGLRHVHSHMLRHTAVSLLIDDGANPKAIQAFVGHARIQETLDTYGHLFDSGGSALAQSMEARREKHRQANGNA